MKDSKKKNYYSLHCTSIYPSQLKDLNIYKIKDYKEKFKIKVGYSDHY